MRRNTRSIFALLLTVGLIPFAGFRPSPQQKQPDGCPTTKVVSPAEVAKGDKLVFTADVKGGDTNVDPTYNWTVSAGTIESGQGTAKIEVSTKEVEVDASITATVELGGYSRDCGYGSTVNSATAVVVKK